MCGRTLRALRRGWFDQSAAAELPGRAFSRTRTPPPWEEGRPAPTTAGGQCKDNAVQSCSARTPLPLRARWRCGQSQVGALSPSPSPPAPTDSTHSQQRRAGLRALRAHSPGRTSPATATRMRQRELLPLPTPSSLGQKGPRASWGRPWARWARPSPNRPSKRSGPPTVDSASNGVVRARPFAPSGRYGTFLRSPLGARSGTSFAGCH